MMSTACQLLMAGQAVLLECYPILEEKRTTPSLHMRRRSLDHKNYIWVTFQKEGIHKYPQALTDPKLKDVSFLGHPHRHIFHFRVDIEVFHDDRDIEFILFKRELESLYSSDGAMNVDFQSCEMIARELYEQFDLEYCSVFEDNENGAEIYYE